MTNRFCLALAAVLSLPFATRGADAPTAKPNILIIVADDMGWGDVGWHGSEIKTPNIDALAASGAKLEQFYVQPLCSPTRAALMTGRYPMRYGIQTGVIRPWATYGLDLNERMLPQAMKQAGYETAITGKWHLGHVSPDYLPTHRGFDHQYGLYNGAFGYFDHLRDGGLDWHRDDKALVEEGYSTALIAKEASRLIKQRDTSKPLFLYVPFNAVHSPHQVPDSYKEPYAALKEPRRTYAGMLAAMDEAIGTILAAVDDQKMRDNTLIFFFSDNGGPAPGRVTSNGPLRGAKGMLYEGGVHVAACASWAGHIKPGTTVDQPLHVVDLFPTLVSLVGGTTDGSKPLDGRDAWQAISAGAPSPNDAILINSCPMNGSVRVGDWKLVINGQKADAEGPEEENARLSGQRPNKQAEVESKKERIELFNLATDPYEKNNLAGENPAKVAELRKVYDKLAAEAVPPLAKPKAADFEVPKVWGEKD
jgi:arylsulfatase A-like enzyme